MFLVLLTARALTTKPFLGIDLASLQIIFMELFPGHAEMNNTRVIILLIMYKLTFSLNGYSINANNGSTAEHDVGKIVK